MVRQDKKLAYSPHFWALIIITVLLATLYYSWPFLDLRNIWLWHLAIFEFRLKFLGSLFYIPLIYAALIFRWRGILAMWLIALAVATPLAIHYELSPAAVTTNVVFLSIPLLITGYVTLELNWRNRERRALIEREKERRTYVTQVFQAQEDERKRIAQGLHDDTIHSLLVVANSVEIVANIVEGLTSRDNFPQGEQLREQVKSIKGEISRITDDLKRLTRDLRPGILDNIGLIPALRWLVDRLHQERNIDTKMIVKGEERKVPHNTDVIIFRIVQEVLNNVRHHSLASEAVVTVEFSDKAMKISIRDNGKGFSVPEKFNSLTLKGKLGLIGIQERVHSLNGRLSIKSKPGGGTTVITRFEV